MPVMRMTKGDMKKGKKKKKGKGYKKPKEKKTLSDFMEPGFPTMEDLLRDPIVKRKKMKK